MSSEPAVGSAKMPLPARMLRLTLLAPDVVEDVIAGMKPDGLSLEKLYRARWCGGSRGGAQASHISVVASPSSAVRAPR
jgi:hypothetical protein